MPGILDRLNRWVGELLAPADPTPPPWDSFWYGSVGGRTRAGVDVNEDTALTYSACWAATRLLAGSGAALPLNLYRRVGGGGKEIAHDHPLHTLLHDAPNPEMSSMMWRAQGIASQVNRGNCYSEIARDPLGRVVALWPIHASRVRACRGPRGELLYEVKVNSGEPKHLDARDVLHVPSTMSEDGITGKGVVAYARETIGGALSRERFSETFFGNGARPGIVVTHPNKMSMEARRNFRQEWAELHAGPDNANKLALLQEGATIKEFGFNLEESQFIEGNQWSVEEVARWYGVPPHLIGHLERATFNNIEELGISFVTYSLILWLKLWEQEIWRKLLSPAEQKTYYAKFLVDALQRGDVLKRTQALTQQFFNGALTLNQWAEIEDRNPIGAAGDLHFVQSAMVPLEVAAKGPQPVEAEDDEAGKLLDVPDRRQTVPYTCGACATWSVADYLGIGDGRTEMDYAEELGTTPADGTQPEAIADWFNDRGCIVTSGPGMTLDDLREFTRANQPVIVPVQMWGVTPEYDAEEQQDQTGHYVVVRGVELGCVFLQDPVAGRVEMAESEFDRRWHDVEADGVKDDHFGIAVRQRTGAKVKPMPVDGDEAEADDAAESTSEPSEAPEGEAVPVESSDAAASQGNVQDTALNGAQVVALIQIVQAVASKEMPPATGKAALQASYPLMDVALIDAMIDPLENFEAPKPPPPPPFGGPPSDGPPAPKEEDADPPEDDNLSAAHAAQTAALRALLVDTLGRMLRKESNAVRRAAARPGELFAWMDEFYPRHQETLAEALAAPMEAAGAVGGVSQTAADVAAGWVEASRESLLAAAEVPADGFGAAAEAMLGRWELRPAEVAGEILGG